MIVYLLINLFLQEGVIYIYFVLLSNQIYKPVSSVEGSLMKQWYIRDVLNYSFIAV